MSDGLAESLELAAEVVAAAAVVVGIVEIGVGSVVVVAIANSVEVVEVEYVEADFFAVEPVAVVAVVAVEYIANVAKTVVFVADYNAAEKYFEVYLDLIVESHPDSHTSVVVAAADFVVPVVLAPVLDHLFENIDDIEHIVVVE